MIRVIEHRNFWNFVMQFDHYAPNCSTAIPAPRPPPAPSCIRSSISFGFEIHPHLADVMFFEVRSPCRLLQSFRWFISRISNQKYNQRCRSACWRARRVVKCMSVCACFCFAELTFMGHTMPASGSSHLPRTPSMCSSFYRSSGICSTLATSAPPSYSSASALSTLALLDTSVAPKRPTTVFSLTSASTSRLSSSSHSHSSSSSEDWRPYPLPSPSEFQLLTSAEHRNPGSTLYGALENRIQQQTGTLRFFAHEYFFGMRLSRSLHPARFCSS